MNQSQMKLLERDSERLGLRIRFAFAVLTGLGGLVLATGTENDAIPVIAVFFSVVGFLCVDWLKIFALPAIAAYAAMAVAALYCISDFVNLDAPGNHQMNAVAQLLVSVQAVMMLQLKTRKILEQLGVFCLLELVVSAIFNDAINYGILMIPICLVGGWGLTLLSAVGATESMSKFSILDHDSSDTSASQATDGSNLSIQARAVSSARSLLSNGIRLPKVTMSTLAPSVAVVGIIFFYAIPRTTSANRASATSNALVGFSDEVRLEQIGQMNQSKAIAATFKLRSSVTRQPYRPKEEVYIRGAVLERYLPRSVNGRIVASWASVLDEDIARSKVLPSEFFPDDSASANFFDQVEVDAVCEATRSGSLFAIAPYHRNNVTSDVTHERNRWSLKRGGGKWGAYPRKRYSFGTHAFREGIQTKLIASTSKSTSASSGNATRQTDSGRPDDFDGFDDRAIEDQRSDDRYRDFLLKFDPEAMGTIESIAESVIEDWQAGLEGDSFSDYDLARKLEAYFKQDGRYRYSLNLNSEPLPGMDPIEQFVAVDRSGHCQYFASALAMMLRSQRIPARLVVGFRTEEFNQIAGHLVARQSHAHAWVEALIRTDQLSSAPKVYGQPAADYYWVRLDPTPPAFLSTPDTSNLGQLMDSAQTAWDDYVVEMDAEKQQAALMGNVGDTGMQSSYSRFVERLSNAVADIRAGRLGEGSWSGGGILSWPLLIIVAFVAVLIAILVRWRRPSWISSDGDDAVAQQVARPSINFYHETLLELEKIGIERKRSQTPDDVRVAVASGVIGSEKLLDPALELLTRSFYQIRFGSSDADSTASILDDSTSDSKPSSTRADLEPSSDFAAKIDSSLDQLRAGVAQLKQHDSEKDTP